LRVCVDVPAAAPGDHAALARPDELFWREHVADLLLY
jgi:hypothetical protein